MKQCLNGNREIKIQLIFSLRRDKTVETPGCVPGAYVYKLYIQDRGKHIFESSIPIDRQKIING